MAPTGCIFCSIVRGETAAHIVYDDDAILAFLDYRPVFHGHTLVIPREHHDTLPDLPTTLIEPLFSAARLMAVAVRDALGADGTFVAMNNVVSQSVPHLHVHVVPRRKKDGLRGFFWPRMKYDNDEHIERVASAIRAAAG